MVTAVIRFVKMDILHPNILLTSSYTFEPAVTFASPGSVVIFELAANVPAGIEHDVVSAGLVRVCEEQKPVITTSTATTTRVEDPNDSDSGATVVEIDEDHYHDSDGRAHSPMHSNSSNSDIDSDDSMTHHNTNTARSLSQGVLLSLPLLAFDSPALQRRGDTERFIMRIPDERTLWAALCDAERDAGGATRRQQQQRTRTPGAGATITLLYASSLYASHGMQGKIQIRLMGGVDGSGAAQIVDNEAAAVAAHYNRNRRAASALAALVVSPSILHTPSTLESTKTLPTTAAITSTTPSSTCASPQRPPLKRDTPVSPARHHSRSGVAGMETTTTNSDTLHLETEETEELAKFHSILRQQLPRMSVGVIGSSGGGDSLEASGEGHRGDSTSPTNRYGPTQSLLTNSSPEQSGPSEATTHRQNTAVTYRARSATALSARHTDDDEVASLRGSLVSSADGSSSVGELLTRMLMGETLSAASRRLRTGSGGGGGSNSIVRVSS